MNQTLSKKEVKQAALKAANFIETHPEQYNFMALNIPKYETDCGCMLGWTSFFAGIEYTCFENFCRAAFQLHHLQFYDTLEEKYPEHDGFVYNVEDAVYCLRHFAEDFL